VLAEGWTSEEDMARRVKEGLLYNVRARAASGSALEQCVVVGGAGGGNAQAWVERMAAMLLRVLEA